MPKPSFTFEAKVEKVESALMWNYFFRVPNDISEWIITENSRRVVVELNNDVELFHGALMHDGKGGLYITLNKQRRTKLGLRSGELIQVRLRPDNSEYGIDISEELLEVLDQDDEGSAWFHELTPGMQRTLIHWVDSVKRSEIKIRRALVLMRHLNELRGELDHKLLNAAIKEANQEAKRR